jgi:intracellular sulfur oxidation DsrE/DsrF family protein
MIPMRFALAVATVALGICCASAQKSDPSAGLWSTPSIQGFGKIREVPDAAYKPDPLRSYKVVFALTKGSKSAGEINPSLDRVARTVNLYVASGVPLAHLKFVAVASGEATAIALDDGHYRQKLSVSNPNLALVAALKKAGVDVAVCAQAVAEHQYEYAWVDKSVTLALSALTTVSMLEQQGYALMPL